MPRLLRELANTAETGPGQANPEQARRGQARQTFCHMDARQAELLTAQQEAQAEANANAAADAAVDFDFDTDVRLLAT